MYDDGVVISAAKNGEVTDYTYGLERISASTGRARTEYVYDGRGSVIGEVTKAGLLSTAKVTTKAYTPFGEQIGEQTSGFGWNGEYYNATTGQVYLRARFYEPEMNRFTQKDILRGNMINGTGFNRYTFCQNDPINFIDPSGKTLKSIVQKAGSAIKSAATSIVSSAVSIANTVVNKAKDILSGNSNSNKTQTKSNSSLQSITSGSSNSSVKGYVGNSVPAQIGGGYAGGGSTGYSTYAPEVKGVASGPYYCSSGLYDAGPRISLSSIEMPWSSLSWRGEIHNAVQNELVAKYGLIKEQQINGGQFRLDLYRPSDHAYWEVKPVSYLISGYKNDSMVKQMENYDNHGVHRGEPLAPGSFPYKDYDVSYVSPAPGMVFYEFHKRNDEKKELDAVSAPASAEEIAEEVKKQGNINIWDALAGGALVATGVLIIIATVAEDVGTLGAGVADDAFTIGGSLEMIKTGATMISQNSQVIEFTSEVFQKVA